MKESIKGTNERSGILKELKKRLGKFASTLKIDPPEKDHPLPVDLANDLLQRKSLKDILSYRDISEDGLMVIEDGKNIRLGFVIRYNPVILAGGDLEHSISSMIGEYSIPNTVIQLGVLSNSWIDPILNGWQDSRSATGKETLYTKMALFRKYFMLAGNHVEPLASKTSPMRPKDHIYFMAVTVPFEGDIKVQEEWDLFEDRVKKMRSSTIGGMSSSGLPASAMNRVEIKNLLRMTLNPHMYPDDLLNPEKKPYLEGGVDDLFSKESRLFVDKFGYLDFSSRPVTDKHKKLASMSVDFYPIENHISITNKLMGDIFSPSERINSDFYLYLNICILDTPRTKERLMAKKATLSRQLISDSPVMRSLAGGLFIQRDELDDMLDLIERGKRIVSLYMGINIWDEEKNIDEAVGSVRSLWANHGFTCSKEPFIGFPMWIGSLPMHFYPHFDPMNNSGLQRMSTMTTSHASFIAPVQGAWRGTPPDQGGLLLLSRQNQLSTFNLQGDIVDNYNFAIVASSGAGKSFFAQEIVMDFLAKDGLAFIIDAGGSYYDLCELLGGTNLVFKMDQPLDLNPFRYIETKTELLEGLELLKSVTLYMMFPNQIENIPDWEDKLVEQALESAWYEKGTKATYVDVSDWLLKYSQDDNNPDISRRRARDMSDQLRPYTYGRFSDWFNGKGKPVDLNAKMVVIEMDDLSSQGSFKGVVLTSMMNRIAEAMYKTNNPKQPKLMLLDEAWALLDNNDAAPHIERAYRTYRKYGGSAGIITQSFKDIKISKASEAAFANSSWIFALKQNKDSYNQAINEGIISPNEVEKRLVEGVFTAKGAFSEVYIKTANGEGVFRFFVDRYSYWLFTTAPQEKSARKEMIEKVQREHPDKSYDEQLGLAIELLSEQDYRKSLGKTPRELFEEVIR